MELVGGTENFIVLKEQLNCYTNIHIRINCNNHLINDKSIVANRNRERCGVRTCSVSVTAVRVTVQVRAPTRSDFTQQRMTTTFPESSQESSNLCLYFVYQGIPFSDALIYNLDAALRNHYVASTSWNGVVHMTLRTMLSETLLAQTRQPPRSKPAEFRRR